MTDDQPPSEDDPHLATAMALDQVARAMASIQDLSHRMGAQLADTIERLNAVAEQQAEDRAEAWQERQTKAYEVALSQFYGHASQYTTIVLAAGYVGFYAALSALSERFSDLELRWATLLLTVSLTAFVGWEVVKAGLLSWSNAAGRAFTEPRWFARVWMIVFLISVGTGLGAAGLLGWANLRAIWSDRPTAAAPAPAAMPPPMHPSPSPSSAVPASR